jgi:hypothetical protein
MVSGNCCLITFQISYNLNALTELRDHVLQKKKKPGHSHCCMLLHYTAILDLWIMWTIGERATHEKAEARDYGRVTMGSYY